MAGQTRILIVCTGNICRSPFIERLLQHELDQRRSGPDQELVVHSAGTRALVGWAMDDQAAAQLVERGGDAGGFRAQALTPGLIEVSDLVLTATRGHRGKVALMSPKALRRVFTFRDFADLVAGIDRRTDSTTPTDPQERVRQVAEKAASSRGLRPPLAPAAADIVDPFGRGDEVFAAMAAQVVESMPAVVTSLVG